MTETKPSSSETVSGASAVTEQPEKKPAAAESTESAKDGATPETALDKVFTIPNILSFLRLCMIPAIILSYQQGHPYWAFAILVLSGLTDIIDGYIARHYNMISNLGKILDPFADKLTQGCIIIVLLTKFPETMFVPLCVMILRETMNSITGMMVIRKTGKVLGAQWHGKAATVVIWTTLVLYIVWPDMPNALRGGLSSAATMMMLISLVLYTIRNINAVQEEPKN